jgi:ubiquinone/menaquinone biosynthesis C-methylase UbiE
MTVARGFHRAVGSLAKKLFGHWVLDLGCGTGVLTECLARQGCHVIGVDRSASMLAVARGRCRRFGKRVRFVKTDLANLHIDVEAAAAFASGDVMNHLTTVPQLGTVLRKVALHLQRGGTLTFDALNRWCFETYWDAQNYCYRGRSGDIFMECDWHAAQRIGKAQMIIYEKHSGRAYRRREGVITERLFENRTLAVQLTRAGFSRVSFRPWSPWPDQANEESVDRTLWTAVR